MLMLWMVLFTVTKTMLLLQAQAATADSGITIDGWLHIASAVVMAVFGFIGMKIKNMVQESKIELKEDMQTIKSQLSKDIQDSKDGLTRDINRARDGLTLDLQKVTAEQVRVKEELVHNQNQIREDMDDKHAENKQSIAVHQGEDRVQFAFMNEALKRIEGKMNGGYKT